MSAEGREGTVGAGAHPSGTGPGPLAGIRVLELGQLIAGPMAARMLADFGADVIKVEPPRYGASEGGDPLRSWRRMGAGDTSDASLWWYVQGRNKRSITLDLRRVEGQEVARRLAADADVLIENFRPGTLERWGLDPQALLVTNPRLVIVRLSGYGQSGPYRDRPGFGAIAEAMGGMRYVNGFPDRPPVRMNLSMGDSLAALHAVIGALLALQERSVSGLGQVVDVALYESVFNLMESALPEFDRFGVVRERTGTNLSGIVPSNTYPCAQGDHIVIGGNGDSIYRRLMRAIGRDDLADDPELASNSGRAARAAEIDAAIAQWTSERTLSQCLIELEAASVPSGPIYSIADIAHDPHYEARGMIQRIVTPDGGRVAIPGVVPRLDRTPGGIRWTGPSLGADSDAVLREAGFDDVQIDRLRKLGVV